MKRRSYLEPPLLPQLAAERLAFGLPEDASRMVKSRNQERVPRYMVRGTGTRIAGLKPGLYTSLHSRLIRQHKVRFTPRSATNHVAQAQSSDRDQGHKAV